MTTSVKQFRDKCYKAASTLQTDARAIVFELAMAAKNDQLTAAHAVGVGDRLRGVGKSGAKIGVGFDILGFTNPTALVRWRGPAHLVNNPTSAHIIVARGFGGTRKKRTQGAALLAAFGLSGAGSGEHALHFGTDDGYAAFVHSPGTDGKHFFEAGVEATKAQAAAILRRGAHRALAKHFTGG